MGAFSRQRYAELLADTLPSVIPHDKDYARLESRFAELLRKGEDGLSPEEDRLFDLLANLLEDYEDRTLAPIGDTEPVEVLRFLMEQNGLRQTDLEDVFGSQSVVSKVLGGKREISKEQAKRLAKKFHLSTDLFI